MKLTPAQIFGLQYLAERDKPSTERTISASASGMLTPRANTLTKLASLGLAELDPYYNSYRITDKGRQEITR